MSGALAEKIDRAERQATSNITQGTLRKQACLGMIAGSLLLTAFWRPAMAGDAESTAQQIDALLSANWEANEVTPNEIVDDRQFLRRASLDLVGVVPSVAAIRRFEADPAADKRHRLIDQLLASPRHATHLANTWRRILLPDGFPAERSGDAIGMQQWLRDRFAQNVRFDRVVGDFLTASGSGETGPVLFYQALNVEPEKLAAATARSFLGLQIQCAQCHDHPFDDWTQKDFWGLAAFFARVRGDQAMGGRGQFQLRDAGFGEVTLPEQDEVVPPAFPGADQPTANAEDSRRLQLSIWVASGNNPYLATATANRVWSLLFGRGIVDPVDNIGDLSAASQPEILELLSKEFVSSGFDLQELFRTIAYTDAYQRSSARPETELDAGSFARMAVKNLTVEQIFDSLAVALQNPSTMGTPGVTINSLNNGVRQSFLVKMAAETHRATEYGSGLQQTLHMMNSPQISGMINDPEKGLVVALQAPFFTDEQRIETIFLAALGRSPSDAERVALVAHLQSAKEEESNTAMSDVLWAVVNSAEFRMNL